MARWLITGGNEMKKLFLVIAVCCGFAMTSNAQELCPCEMENNADALLAVAMSRPSDDYISADINSGIGITATAALIAVGLKVYESLPNATYAIKVEAGGEIRYSTVSSCQMALEKAYDILRQNGVEEVRIISEEFTFNGSCRNKSYYPSDLQDVKARRDNYGKGIL